MRTHSASILAWVWTCWGQAVALERVAAWGWWGCYRGMASATLGDVQAVAQVGPGDPSTPKGGDCRGMGAWGSHISFGWGSRTVGARVLPGGRWGVPGGQGTGSGRQGPWGTARVYVFTFTASLSTRHATSTPRALPPLHPPTPSPRPSSPAWLRTSCRTLTRSTPACC